ncbi:hypothetical protein, partial [Paenibacillus brasilensis]|uniref:hypothetical protein n=1 Tax=Paenibacillus brasilensis TaxID=128574 RepID=UPI0027D8DB38
PRGRHPCPWLTVPTAKPVADFHRQVIAHAGRTRKRSPSSLENGLLLHFSASVFQFGVLI